MKKSILVVASHPDDEALGCGGTILKEVENGNKVHLIFMTNGISARSETKKKDIKSRLAASKFAQSILGISSVKYLNYPDNRMDTIPLLDIVKKIEIIINKLQPSIIYTHHFGDLNVDHKLTHSAVMTACRPIPNCTVREIYGFEILSSTEWSTPKKSPFTPTCFIDITQHFQNKLRALEAYYKEMRTPPHSRSLKHIEVLAQHRGHSMGVDLAEAFEVYRIIN